MLGKRFFDTTILIYSVSLEDARAVTAEKLLTGGGYVSVQVTGTRRICGSGPA